MRKIRPIFILACLGLLFFHDLSTTVVAEVIEKEPITSAGLEEIIEGKDATEVTISYVLEEKKDLFLKTDQADMIDIAHLRQELGTEKIQLDSEKNEIKVTLDNKDRIDFKILVNKTTPFLLSVMDSDKNEIFNYQFNKVEPFDIVIDDDDDPAEEATWNRSDKLRVSKGPILEHEDGSSTQPIFYFGDYIYAEHNLTPVAATWIVRGKSRQNSLTAPNSGIIYAEPGSKIAEGPRATRNHIYTTHYGDSQKRDFNAALTEEEDRQYGSPTSYTSNSLFNYVVQSDSKLRPGTSGPNKIGKSYAMLDTPVLYYRNNHQTGLEEQRLVYKQRAFFEEKKHRDNPEITTTIKMSFTRTGRVITDISYRNSGKCICNNFIGFSNHDLSLNKDGTELMDASSKKIGNYIPMRSLGNERGMYFQSPNNEIRTNIYMNQKNAPGAWAARSASRSYLATKGYMYNPGLIGLLGVQKETYYPWKVGKNTDSSFFDKKKNIYKFPYTPAGYYNAFKNQDDLGDKGQLRGAGTRLGTKNETDPQWDAGVTMRTAPINLEIGKTVHLQYGTMTDIPGSTFSPVVEYDNLSNQDYPQVLALGTKNLELNGHWYDFDSENVTVYYAIDSDDPKEISENILMTGKQSKESAANGDFHDFSKKVNITGLDKGEHKIYLIAEDEDGNKSVLQEHNFKLIKRAETNNGPQIDVTSPSGNKKTPYAPVTDHFAMTGVWSDRQSEQIKSLSYSIDEGPEVIFAEDIVNSKTGKLVPWEIEDLSIKDFNDFERHKMVFKITNSEGLTDTDTFYFKDISGSTHLVAPEQIDFGQLSLSTTSNNRVKPNMKGERVLLEDFREKGSNPLGVSLSIKKFYKDNGYPGDDSDSGDDSETTVDPDRESKESLLHKVYWNGAVASSKNILVGQTNGAKNQEWQQTTDFTDEIVEKLKINFKARAKGSSPGKYISFWTWETIDSVQ